MAAALNLLFLHCELPQSWSEITATLVPKLAVPSGPKDFRPIAALVTLRKLVGYLFLYFAPSPSWQTFQCGFVSGRDAAQAVFCVKRLGEVAKVWKQHLYIAQLDMSKAFDKVYHSAILTALDKIHAGSQLKAFIANMLRQSSVSVNLGNVRTEKVRLDRGVPQGAPESPFLFILVTEMALASLHDSWAERGLGYLIDGCWLPEVAYADDVVLLAMSIAALQTMLLEVEQVFAAVGLTLNLGKTNFTSTLACEGSTLELSGHVVKWSPRLTFLGTVITLCGNDDEAIRARMTRALRAFQNWSPLLTNKTISVAARVAAFLTSVMSSFCWQAQNWTPTKKQYKYIGSWFARLGSSMIRVRRCPEEPMDSWWRRLHRDGKRFWTKHHVDVINMVKATKFRFAGHAARLPVTDIVHQVLKVLSGEHNRLKSAPLMAQDRTCVASTLCTAGKVFWKRISASLRNHSLALWWVGCKQHRTEMIGKLQ